MELNTVLPLSNEIISYNKTENIFLDKNENLIFSRKNKATRVERSLSGTIIIVYKTSYFNSLRGELDGHFALHEKYDEEAYLRVWHQIKNMMESEEMNHLN